MSTLSTGHELEDIAVRDTRVSDAIDEPMRAMILGVLTDEALTAGDVHERLVDRGIDRTENTVRHHIIPGGTRGRIGSHWKSKY